MQGQAAAARALATQISVLLIQVLSMIDVSLR
jgi:hypothetical protein